MAQFIDPFTDTGFKIIFGKEGVSNEILREFLKVLFADDPDLSKIKGSFILTIRTYARMG